MSFRLSFHLALLGRTGAHWLDDLPDVTYKDRTQQHSVDGSLLSCKQELTAVCRDRGLIRPADKARWVLMVAGPVVVWQ
jgi:hypothetical protein